MRRRRDAGLVGGVLAVLAISHHTAAFAFTGTGLGASGTVGGAEGGAVRRAGWSAFSAGPAEGGHTGRKRCGPLRGFYDGDEEEGAGGWWGGDEELEKLQEEQRRLNAANAEIARQQAASEAGVSEERDEAGVGKSTAELTDFGALRERLLKKSAVNASKDKAKSDSNDFAQAEWGNMMNPFSDRVPHEWCRPITSGERPPAGSILMAAPEPFVEGTEDQSMLEKFGFAQPIPKGIDPDRQADLLPVMLIMDINSDTTSALMLNRRTGMLCGDLGEQMKAFMIQPIWLGGHVRKGDKGILTFLHLYTEREVSGAQKLTEDGIYFGGDFQSAASHVTKGEGSGFNFRFFMEFTTWKTKDLLKELEEGKWVPALAGKRSLMKPRDKKGPNKCPPMWTDLMTKAADIRPEYQRAVDLVYKASESEEEEEESSSSGRSGGSSSGGSSSSSTSSSSSSRSSTSSSTGSTGGWGSGWGEMEDDEDESKDERPPSLF